jgi:3-polyprenyl-4-hydroxybenzoate decarboxylase
MMLPGRVKIGPVTYTVTEVGQVEGEPMRMGSFDNMTATLLVREALPTDVKIVTFWHEVFHGLADVSGQVLTEQQVDALAHGLVSLFADNHWTVAVETP